jgi:hypothetical protein
VQNCAVQRKSFSEMQCPIAQAPDEDLLPVLLAPGAWGNRWLSRAIVQVHPASGRLLDSVWVDRQSGRVLDSGSVALAAGPDAQHGSVAALTAPRRLGASGPSVREASW